MRHSLSSALPETGRLPDPGPPPKNRAPIVERIASWSAHYKKTAVLGWLALVVAAFIGGQMFGTKDLPNYDAGSSGQAERTLQHLGFTAPPGEQVLISARPGSHAAFATDAGMRAAAREVTSALKALPGSARGIRSPLDPGQHGLVSADGHSALVAFTVPGNVDNEDQTVVPDLRAVTAVQARHPGLVIAEAGDASEDRVGNSVISHDFRKAEVTSVPITLILLIGVFGALIAAGIPLLLAATAVISAISLLAVPSHWLPVGGSTSEVVLIIGMAVGIDYSLFYLRREREERAKGRSTLEALQIAARTSGRSILVSGLTVMIALGGLFLTGVDVFTGIAIGTVVVVGVAVIGSLTVLPALLSCLGKWADRGRIPWLGRRRTAAGPSRLWAALVRRVVRRPAVWGGIAALAMLVLAAPAVGLHLADPPNGGFPTNVPIVKTADRIAQQFPGSPAPAQVVVTGQDLGSPRVARAISALRAEASSHGPLRPPVTAAAIAGGRALIVSVPLAGPGDGPVTENALAFLRDHALPSTLGRVGGLTYNVGGNAAESHDDIVALHSRTPLVLAVVAVLAFLLLLLAFRSVAVSLISVGLNLLSVGAAYGVVTWVFQDGHLQRQLGFTSYGGIVSWIPLFLFVFLFGLSMDYHVFILSRIRELRSRGASTPDAVIGGISSSAGVVTSAAVIMVAVFSILATLSVISLKMLGVGLAVAVLIDATIVRGILVPAAISLLGERVWALPAGRRGPVPAGPAPAGAVPARTDRPLSAGLGQAGQAS
jgi:RND superfamily putative drug exporter